MAKVTKKQLGRRRRIAALLLLAILIAIPVSISQCVSAINKTAKQAATKQTDVSAENSPAQTTTIPSVRYSGTIPLTTDATERTEPAELSARSCQISVSPILQNPELPTGCEITSLTMALNYAGYPVDKCTIADEYLIRSDPYLTTFGEAFVGSPYDPNAWGCYAPVIQATAEKFIMAQGGSETIENLTGCSLKTLLWEVENGTPVITWVTIKMKQEVEERYYWTTPDGEDAVWLRNEHCVLLCGYDLDANTVTVCDPLEGKIDYDMDIFSNCHKIMYQQAVVIRKNQLTDSENVEMTVQ